MGIRVLLLNRGELLQDLLVVTAKKVTLYEDLLSFAGVCTSWRSAATSKTCNRPYNRLPWLMLSENKHNPDFRDFYSLSKDRIVRKNHYLPEAKGKLCIESKGWLITIGGDGDMSLLHPFSRQQIQLPYQSASVEYEWEETGTPFFFIPAAALSASPSETCDYVLMVIHGSSRYLGFWRPGDVSWTRIETRENLGAYNDITYYDGYFYATANGGCVMKCDVWGPNPTVAHCVATIPRDMLGYKNGRLYLVEFPLPHKLFVIRRNGDERRGENLDTYGVQEFKAFEVDLINKTWVQRKSLGDRAVFVGHSDSFSVKAHTFLDVIKENHIYFTDDNILSYAGYEDISKGGGEDMGFYNMEDGSFKPHFKGQSIDLICPPVWVTPSFH